MSRISIALLALAAGVGCSDEKNETIEDPGPGCTSDPLACPAGTTCWPVDISGRYDCLSAPAAQTAGSACEIDLGHADCAPGLFCFPTASASGVCSPFCSSADDCGGAVCTAMRINEVEFSYDILVCVAAAPADAGSD